MDQTGKLDSYDRKILRLLAGQGRMSWKDLSDAIGSSLTPTLRRVRRLESTGFIQGYAALIDERRLIGGLSAFASISLERQSEEALAMFEDYVRHVQEVTSCSQVTGNSDYILRIVVRDLDHYQATLARVTQIPGVSRIQSSFVLKAVVQASTPGL